MKNYKIKTSFVSPEWPKAQAYKTGINSIILILIFEENFYNSMLYMNFQSGREPVLIQRIVIGFESILENPLNNII